MAGLSLAADRTVVSAPSGTGIVRPGEAVTIDRDFDGPSIECGRLTIAAGAVVRGAVKAGSVRISGRVEGVVRLTGRNSYAVVEEGGSVAGEIHAASIEIRGDVDGICHASSVVLLASARIDGGILTDSLINHPTARISGAAFVGPGLVSNKSMLDGLRQMALAASSGARAGRILPAGVPTSDVAAPEDALELDDVLFESELLEAAERRAAASAVEASAEAAIPVPASRHADVRQVAGDPVPQVAPDPEPARVRETARPATAFPFLVARRG